MSAHRKLIVITATIAALALPAAAQALPQSSSPGSQPYTAAEPQSVIATYAAVPEVVVTSSDNGFSWSDAAIGASAALALMALTFGAALVVRSNRAERARFHLT